eukprot:TRINITY_DN4723_c0_g1_i7.p1 TRINITY_DN4723_c0_g1~~TRINITY_DN4723_c0_g1_i7.p1  ORF type:complete len:110 (+),score=8.94 TRINITY_DN4723_c0_g1_i7:127-456(+)
MTESFTQVDLGPTVTSGPHAVPPSTSPPSSNPFVGLYTTFLTNGITGGLKRVFGTWKNFHQLRPMGEFFSRDRLMVPKIAEIPSRLTRNLNYFQSNYILVFCILSLYSA